jgi:hypothetical protein
MHRIVMLSVIYAQCHLCSVPFMLSVTYKPFMLSAIMLNVVLLSAIMLNVIARLWQLKIPIL